MGSLPRCMNYQYFASMRGRGNKYKTYSQHTESLLHLVRESLFLQNNTHTLLRRYLPSLANFWTFLRKYMNFSRKTSKKSTRF